MGNHLTNEDLIHRLYEVADESVGSHLTGCAECRARWEQLLARRQVVMAEPEVPADLLAAQRREIYRRLESRETGFWHLRLAPALAALSMVVLGLVLSRPAPAPEPTTLAVNDSQFYTEIYSMIESTEPEAAAPLYALFEE